MAIASTQQTRMEPRRFYLAVATSLLMIQVGAYFASDYGGLDKNERQGYVILMFVGLLFIFVTFVTPYTIETAKNLGYVKPTNTLRSRTRQWV